MGTYGGSAYGTSPYGGGQAPSGPPSHALAGALTITTSVAGELAVSHPLAGGTGVTITAAATRLAMAQPLAGGTGVSLTLAGALVAPPASTALAGGLTVTISTAGRIRLAADPTGVYSVKVVTRAGAVLHTFANATVDRVELDLNDIGSASFHLHTLDPEGLSWLPPDQLGGRREVQIWRDGVCIFWGVPLSARANKTRVTFECAGLLWYYTRRYFGPVQNNYLANPDFESGLTSWTGVNTTATVSTTWRALGTQSVKLVQTAENADGYLRQRYTTTTGNQETFFAVKALCHIQSAGWVGPALGERGLYIEQQSTPGGAAIDGTAEVETPYGPKWEPINENTPRGHHRPVRLETGIFVPANTTRTIEVRLYSPGGTIWWDATALVVEESVGSAVTGDAANHIINRVNAYAQDAAQGKSDLSISLDGAPGTYPHLVRIYQFFDNGNIWEALSEYPAIGACDLEVRWPSLTATSRKLTMYPGGKGTLKAGSPINFATNVVGDFAYDVDAARITTRPRVLGQGEGADREVGIAVDTSQMDGLVLESVASAPLEAPIDSLQRLADEDLADSLKPIRLPEVTIPAEGFINGVELGDTVPLTMDYGYVQESTNRRVVKMSLNGDDDSLRVTVNA